MKIVTVDTISFKYSSPLKTEWRKNAVMREHVKYGLYGGELNFNNITLEHLVPHSKGGKTKLNNLALATSLNNGKRSSLPLKENLTKEMFLNYIEQFKGWCAQLFDNKKYITDLANTAEAQGIKVKELIK